LADALTSTFADSVAAEGVKPGDVGNRCPFERNLHVGDRRSGELLHFAARRGGAADAYRFDAVGRQFNADGVAADHERPSQVRFRERGFVRGGDGQEEGQTEVGGGRQRQG
jgi:hypothetical protein